MEIKSYAKINLALEVKISRHSNSTKGKKSTLVLVFQGLSSFVFGFVCVLNVCM